MSVGEFAYRPALDGIRCIAVSGVIVYHLDRRWLPGGFLGVDVFFTLSGYLITALLLVERDRTGRISLPAFWARRARRLLPASLLVVAATVVWLAHQSPVVQAARNRDVIAAVTNLMNWHLIASGQSYFEGFNAASPLRHFWSLAVEEQFYLVWPALCLVLLGTGRLRRIAAFSGLAALGSVVACAVLYDSADPSRAYYGTDARVHQVFVGVLLAVWLAHRGAPPVSVHVTRSRLVGSAGAAAAASLAVAFVLMNDTWSGYYRGGSLAVALMTAVLILSIERVPTAAMSRSLGTRPLAAVGRVSYGLYHWHWPVIVWMGPGVWGIHSELGLTLVRIAVTTIVAAASFRLIERPIRTGRVAPLLRPRNVALVSVALLISVALASTALTWNAEPPAWATGPAERLTTTPTGSSTTPTGSSATPERQEPRLGILGDSVAASLAPGLTSTLGREGWSIFDASAPGCPLTALPQGLDDGREHPKNEQCGQLVPELRSQLLRFRPDVVLWHDLQSTLPVLIDGRVIPTTDPRWSTAVLDAWEQRAEEFRGLGASVIVVIPPLRSLDPKGVCSTDRCTEIQLQDERIRSLTATFVDRHFDDSWFHTLDLDPSLCPTGMPCPITIDGIEVRLGGRDQTHFTPEGATLMAPTLIAAIEAALG